MAPLDDNCRSGELEFLQNILRDTSRRHVTVQEALSSARETLEQAQQAVDDLAAEDDSLRTRCAELSSQISTRRTALERATRQAKTARVRRLLARMPEELLQAIFLEHCDYSEVWKEGDENWGRSFWAPWDSAPPFMLAAVNQRWRDIALRTSAIWTFVAVPNLNDTTGAMFLEYVRVVLERSRKRDLDVMLSWTDCSWEKTRFHRLVIAALCEHTHRWRRVSIAFPSKTPESVLRFLRMPLPRLEDLFLGNAKDVHGHIAIGWSSTSAAYLPCCPRLRRLRNAYLFIVPHQPYTELVYLSIHVDDHTPSHVLWNFLRMTPALQDLQLNFASECYNISGQNTPDSSLMLPKLWALGIYGQFDTFLPWVMALQMPCLYEFRTVNVESLDALAALLDKFAESLTSLVIVEMHVDDDAFSPEGNAMQYIRRLQRLRRVVFRDCTAIGPDIPAIFASREATGLPLLETVAVENPEMDDEEAAHLSSLMQALKASLELGEKDAVGFTLKAQEGDVPGWLINQYEYITGGRGYAESAVSLLTAEEIAGEDI
ncbi:hypothetical protein AURDEDRAFT_160209 [Auricularia subglabra TFB-10046 SS5]|nr:hypothetical protein AURDEDRAFT_160209 [Auricularia subglabra TFB-10046 SS5]